MIITVEPHPSLHHGAFLTAFPDRLSAMPSPPWLAAFLRLDAAAPLSRDENVRRRIRDLLRHGGYKPTGRGKPAAEYLVRAAGDGSLGSINLAVDACNAVSLHSGIPISMIDVERAEAPFTIRLAGEGESYVFNATGQTIDLKGLLCLCDVAGPCANAVKDAQRTKTDGDTRRTLTVLWSCVGLEERLERAVLWYRELLERAGAATVDVPRAGEEVAGA